MAVKLTEGDQMRGWAEKYQNLDVYLKVIQALSIFREGTKESLMRYGQIGQEIIDTDPESPFGYRIRAWYNMNLAEKSISPRENFKKAFQLTQKALAMDESEGFSHMLLGKIYLLMRKYEQAIASGKRSVELQPNGAMVHVALGSTLNEAGRIDKL